MEFLATVPAAAAETVCIPIAVVVSLTGAVGAGARIMWARITKQDEYIKTLTERDAKRLDDALDDKRWRDNSRG